MSRFITQLYRRSGKLWFHSQQTPTNPQVQIYSYSSPLPAPVHSILDKGELVKHSDAE